MHEYKSTPLQQRSSLMKYIKIYECIGNMPLSMEASARVQTHGVLCMCIRKPKECTECFHAFSMLLLPATSRHETIHKCHVAISV